MKRGRPLRRKTPLRAKKGLSRSSRLSRGKGVRKRNPERTKREFNRAYGGEERAYFVRDMECCVPGCRNKSENAHLPGAGGMGYKGHADTVCNLCGVHHRTHPQSLHELGSVRRFKEEWGVFLPSVAGEVERKWQERSGE